MSNTTPRRQITKSAAKEMATAIHSDNTKRWRAEADAIIAPVFNDIFVHYAMSHGLKVSDIALIRNVPRQVLRAITHVSIRNVPGISHLSIDVPREDHDSGKYFNAGGTNVMRDDYGTAWVTPEIMTILTEYDAINTKRRRSPWVLVEDYMAVILGYKTYGTLLEAMPELAKYVPVAVPPPSALPLVAAEAARSVLFD